VGVGRGVAVGQRGVPNRHAAPIALTHGHARPPRDSSGGLAEQPCLSNSMARRVLRVAWLVGGAALTVLTLPSVPEDVAGWAKWLSWVDARTARWLLPALGWLALGGLILYMLVRQRADAPRPRTDSIPDGPRVSGVFRSDRATPTREPADRDVSTDAPHGSGRAQLREDLQALYNEGDALLQALPHPLGAAFRGLMIASPTTTEQDVDAWEAEVEHRLVKEPKLRAIFMRKPPPVPFPGLRSIALGGSPLRTRMSQRLRQLAQIIRGL
jgi:hypothetical protein